MRAELDGQPVEVAIEPSTGEFTAAGRTDTPPIFGGYRVNLSLACTLGFSTQSGASKGYVTAGHCGDVGTWSQVPGGPWLGPVINREISNVAGTDTDSAWVCCSDTSGYVYVNDGPANKPWRSVKGWWTNGAAEGSLVYVSDGYTDGTFWNWLYRFDYTMYGSGYRIEHAQDAPLCAQYGDSGSPVYTVDGSGNAWAAGILSATTDASPSCPYGELLAWSRIDRVLSSMGVSLVTS